MRISCDRCGKPRDLARGHVNRSRAKGHGLYCGRKCSGIARRKHKTKAQRVAEKREYDMKYRALNRERLIAEKRAYFKRTYDPKKAARIRKKRMHLHVAYCRRPAYRAKKATYDRNYRAAKVYGAAYGECFLLLQDLETEIASRMTKYEIKLANGLLNKKMQRRRDDENLNRF